MTAQRAPSPVRPPSSADKPAPLAPSLPASVSLAPSAAPLVSVQAYMDSERGAMQRHEYVDGVILAVAGETANHNRIAGNVYRQLGNRFEDSPCDVFIENIRVRVTPTQYRYPDVAAQCERAEFDAERPPCLLNPAVIFEVLSPSTQEQDRGEKFMEYRGLPSLTDYVLIAQDRVQVAHYARQSALEWVVRIYERPDDVLTLPALGVSLPLADIYRKIVFDAPPAPAAS